MALNKLTELIRKKYKDEDIILTREREVVAVSSGSLILDNILGGGLLMEGRLTEIFGAESSGKTTLCLQSAVNAVKAGKEVLFLDFEQTFDVKYGEALGLSLNCDKLLVLQPKNLEQGKSYLKEYEKVAEVGKSVIIVDSVAAAKPQELLDGAGDQQRIGLHAQRFGEFANYLNSYWAGKMRACILMTNQLRKAPSTGSMFQAKATKDNGIGFGVSADTSVTTTGGLQLRYLYSLRVMLEFAGRIEEGSFDKGNLKRTGNFVKAYTVKNKVRPPFQSAKMAVVYGKGFVDDFAIIETLKEYDYITSSGAILSYTDSQNNEIGKGLSFKAKGKEAFYNTLKEKKYQEDMYRTFKGIMENDEAVKVVGDDDEEDELDL